MEHRSRQLAAKRIKVRQSRVFEVDLVDHRSVSNQAFVCGVSVDNTRWVPSREGIAQIAPLLLGLVHRTCDVPSSLIYSSSPALSFDEKRPDPSGVASRPISAVALSTTMS